MWCYHLEESKKIHLLNTDLAKYNTESFKICNSCIIPGLISVIFSQEFSGNPRALGNGVADVGIPLFWVSNHTPQPHPRTVRMCYWGHDRTSEGSLEKQALALAMFFSKYFKPSSILIWLKFTSETSFSKKTCSLLWILMRSSCQVNLIVYLIKVCDSEKVTYITYTSSSHHVRD